MVDMIGAVVGTAIYTVLVGVLIAFSPVRRTTKLAAVIVAAVWGGTVVAMAALGGFAPGATGPVPAPVFAFVVLLAALFGGWFFLPQFRSALLSIPVPALIGLNAMRVGGIFFLILFAGGRLSAPFAPIAGSGDILVALFAIPLAVMATGGAWERLTSFRLWNSLGTLDLIVAVSLALLSAPGTPFRVFTDGPGTLAMTTLPWIMVPTMIVPLYFLIHLTIAAKTRSFQDATQVNAMAPGR
jgi:hypothetical protein